GRGRWARAPHLRARCRHHAHEGPARARLHAQRRSGVGVCEREEGSEVGVRSRRGVSHERLRGALSLHRVSRDLPQGARARSPEVCTRRRDRGADQDTERQRHRRPSRFTFLRSMGAGGPLRDPERPARAAGRQTLKREPATRRVCFVTCLAWPDISGSDAHVARALEARGIGVAGRPWNAEGASFDGFDAVIFRSSWDYHHTPEAFLAWLTRWKSAGVRFWNSPDLVRWNLTKRHLLDLEQRGVHVVPTHVLQEPASRHLPALLVQRGWAQAVVKPLVGASGHHATLVRPGDVQSVAAA